MSDFATCVHLQAPLLSVVSKVSALQEQLPCTSAAGHGRLNRSCTLTYVKQPNATAFRTSSWSSLGKAASPSGSSSGSTFRSSSRQGQYWQNTQAQGASEGPRTRPEELHELGPKRSEIWPFNVRETLACEPNAAEPMATHSTALQGGGLSHAHPWHEGMPTMLHGAWTTSMPMPIPMPMPMPRQPWAILKGACIPGLQATPPRCAGHERASKKPG